MAFKKGAVLGALDHEAYDCSNDTEMLQITVHNALTLKYAVQLNHVAKAKYCKCSLSKINLNVKFLIIFE